VATLDADAALTRLAATRHGVVTRREAAELGLSWPRVRHRVELGMLREPVRGVLTVSAHPASFAQRVLVAISASSKGAVASHRTAAALHGLDGFVPDVVELSIAGRGRCRDPRATLHRVDRLDALDRVCISEIPVTGLARTLADLGSVVREPQLLRALDDARRRGASLRWLRETAERLHRPGQGGTGMLLRLLDEAERDRVVPDSWLERLVEAVIVQPGLPPFERQHVVRDQRGRFVARIDGAFPSIRLGIEAHSRRFHFGAGPEARDEDRDLRLAALGWELLYVGWQHTRRPAEAAALVVAVVRERMKSRG
jgi:hypothetical protein